MTTTAVAAANQLAAEAGASVSALGGNAVDAALAATITACVTEPGICSLGGGAYLAIWEDGKDPVTVDGYVEMPGRGRPSDAFGRGYFDVELGYGGGVTTAVGYGSVATPGTLASFGRAHVRFGRAPWAEVVAPAIAAARDGFPLGQAADYYLGYSGELIYGWQETSRQALTSAAGHRLRAGQIMKLPELADALDEVASQGWEAAYTGSIGQIIAADHDRNEGLLSAEDLAAYEPLLRPSLYDNLAGWALSTNPPPAIGGASLLAMLALMEGHGLTSPRDRARLVAVQEAVLGFRKRRIDGTDDADGMLARLAELSRTSVEELLAAAKGASGPTSPSTVHTSAVDSDGNGCAITASAGYGAGVMVPGTGMWMNNSLGEHELNVRGVHSLPVGTKLPSNMAPTVARRDDGAVLAIGSPGADRITTAILQTLVAMSEGATLEEAIRHPRLHVEVGDDGSTVKYEADLALPDDLGRAVHELDPVSMFFGGVGAAMRAPDGTVHASADPRRASGTAVG